MKKFLSLVLALIMTFSLVTIGAGATEYKDLTDKSEITYEEAVAVLNKLGIISGYSDGSFGPTAVLTRGAAAKIIVSLMIGTEAASNLAVNAAPYSDVPANHTFAGVISYCKTAGYINGYSDGSFRPADPLTGYAFSKMLLGALGYDGKQEGFSGLGWTMNVNKLGNEAGLFRDFVNGFKGNNGLTREEACLLALNTLKATEVEYSGGTTISTSTGDATTSITTNKERSYKLSNDAKINKNISGKTAQIRDEVGGDRAGYKTLEFGEEHFQNLVLDTTKTDDYGRPANTWSLKNVKIGTYAKLADYTYTAGASGDTDADKIKSMGLKDYEYKNTTLTVNGWKNPVTLTGSTTDDAKDLLKYVKNGSLVQVYLDEDDANVIEYVAVTMTQIMKINRVTTKDATLKTVEGTGISETANEEKNNGYKAVNVNAIKSDDEVYSMVKDLKSDDFVVVTPLTTNQGSTYSADKIFIPTTASGTISKVKVNNSDNNSDGLTVGGTDYKMSRNWTAEDAGGKRVNAMNGWSVNTKRESTVYLDSYGYAIYVSNVQTSTEFFIFDEYYQSLVDGKVHYFAQGWDIKGQEVSLDFGTMMANYHGAKLEPGHVYAYTNSKSSNADYDLDEAKTDTQVIWTYDNEEYKEANNVTTNMELKASDIAININKLDMFADGTRVTANKTGYPKSTNGSFEYKKDVKFLFPTLDDSDNTLETVTCKNGSQKVDRPDSFAAQIVLKNVGTAAKPDYLVSAVVMASDQDVEVSQSVVYIKNQTYETVNDGSKKHISLFKGYFGDEVKSDQKADKIVSDGSFYTYKLDEASGIYTVNAYTRQTGKATSVIETAVFKQSALSGRDKNYLAGTDNTGNSVTPSANGTVEMLNNLTGRYDGVLSTSLNLADAKIVDTRSGGTISSPSDLAGYDGKDVGIHGKLTNVGKSTSNVAFKVAVVYNDSNSSSNWGRVAYLYILEAGAYDDLKLDNGTVATSVTYTAPKHLLVSKNGTTWGRTVELPATGATTFYVKGAVEDGKVSIITDKGTDSNMFGGAFTVAGPDEYGVYTLTRVTTVSYAFRTLSLLQYAGDVALAKDVASSDTAWGEFSGVTISNPKVLNGILTYDVETFGDEDDDVTKTLDVVFAGSGAKKGIVSDTEKKKVALNSLVALLDATAGYTNVYVKSDFTELNFTVSNKAYNLDGTAMGKINDLTQVSDKDEVIQAGSAVAPTVGASDLEVKITGTGSAATGTATANVTVSDSTEDQTNLVTSGTAGDGFLGEYTAPDNGAKIGTIQIDIQSAVAAAYKQTVNAVAIVAAEKEVKEQQIVVDGKQDIVNTWKEAVETETGTGLATAKIELSKAETELKAAQALLAEKEAALKTAKEGGADITDSTQIYIKQYNDALALSADPRCKQDSGKVNKAGTTFAAYKVSGPVAYSVLAAPSTTTVLSTSSTICYEIYLQVQGAQAATPFCVVNYDVSGVSFN